MHGLADSLWPALWDTFIPQAVESAALKQLVLV